MKSAATDLVGLGIPFLGSLCMVGRVAAATYEFLPTSIQESLGPKLGLNTTILIDVDRQMSRLTAAPSISSLGLTGSNANTDASFR